LPLTGCFFLEDVAQKYDLYEETRAVLLAQAPAFHNSSVPIQKIPAGRAHWFVRPDDVRKLLEAMSFEPLSEAPEKRNEAFALVFLPSDPVSRMVFFLDRNLNLLPGFLHHGAHYGSSFYRTSDEFKLLILSRIESCPSTREFLPDLKREWSERSEEE